jgi:dTDP-4-amino-4,6-dideoxygalactose transaminase
MKVAFLDMKAPYLELQQELDVAYRRVMDSGMYILGGEVEAFEREYADYVGVGHCVGVGCGLDALFLMLKAAGIEAGDSVIVPANTYIATWLAVSMCGATPVPVEPDPSTYNINPECIQKAITHRTKAILAVHLYGLTADMSSIKRIAAENGLKVFEDAAQSHGATLGNARSGGLADAAGISFYPGKNLGAFGDAGAVATSEASLADKARTMRNYGSRVKYQNEVRGVNSRLDPLQAAFLRVKLAHLDEWNARRRAVAAQYIDGLADCAGLVLPHVPEGAEPCWHQFVVRHERRNDLQRHLDDCGIGTLIHYPVPPHLSGAYAGMGFARGAFPITEHLADTVLSLPIGPHISTDDVQTVINAIRSFKD